MFEHTVGWTPHQQSVHRLFEAADRPTQFSGNFDGVWIDGSYSEEERNTNGFVHVSDARVSSRDGFVHYVGRLASVYIESERDLAASRAGRAVQLFPYVHDLVGENTLVGISSRSDENHMMIATGFITLNCPMPTQDDVSSFVKQALHSLAA